MDTLAVIFQQLIEGRAIICMTDDEDLFDTTQLARSFSNSSGAQLVSQYKFRIETFGAFFNVAWNDSKPFYSVCWTNQNQVEVDSTTISISTTRLHFCSSVLIIRLIVGSSLSHSVINRMKWWTTWENLYLVVSSALDRQHHRPLSRLRKTWEELQWNWRPWSKRHRWLEILSCKGPTIGTSRLD